MPSVEKAASPGAKLVRVPMLKPVGSAVKVAPAAEKMDCGGRSHVEEARTKVPLGPRLRTVPPVVRAGPPGVREVVPRVKPDGSGVNVMLAAVKMELVAVGGGVVVGSARVRVKEPEGPAASMPAFEGRRE